MEDNKSFFKSPWLYVGLATVALFALCFWGIDYISRPDLDDTPKVEKEVIATLDSNPELILLARQQGWIKETATEMTSVDASKVTRIDSVFSGCKLETFDEQNDCKETQHNAICCTGDLECRRCPPDRGC